MPQLKEQSTDLPDPFQGIYRDGFAPRTPREVDYLYDIALSARRIAKALETLNKLQ